MNLEFQSSVLLRNLVRSVARGILYIHDEAEDILLRVFRTLQQPVLRVYKRYHCAA